MSQIFKKKMDENILFDFLNTVCVEKKKYYIFDLYCFRKALIDNNVNKFIEKIKPYYYKSKLFYLERKMNYKFFSTIIRQLCKHLFLSFTSKLIYYKSTYEIKYFIYPMIKS